MDTAHAFAINDCNANVACLTPIGSPGVLYLIVRGSVISSTIADNKNTMVEVGTTVSSDDTASVSLEDALVSLDSN